MSKPQGTNFTIRDAKEEDIPFIFATWLNGNRYGNQLIGWWDKDDYFERYHRGLEAILTSQDTFITVACLNDDPDTILGYAVLGPDGLVHYVHVKDAFRKFGIARALCPDPITRATFMTPVGWAILSKKYPKAKFIPVR